MVHAQLQLKWPNHSTHLLTRLTYLFKNEQLVDCTLMCNKHSLKVHRSVLAACSPYFERELQNNPSIVVKDVQFSVLQALIEFMYYGETRITEENLTSLIEAAKLFEVKGLSEMDLVNDTGIISSVATAETDCIVDSSCLSDDHDKHFDASQLQSAAISAIQLNHLDSYQETNNVMVESTSAYEPHSSRNFVVTPPQTESAQILLSLARSHSQKFSDLADNITSNGFLSQEKPIEHSINNNILFTEHNLILNDIPSTNDGLSDIVIDHLKPSQLACNDRQSQEADKSLLAKLLTRNNQCTKARYDDNYKTLYETETSKVNELQSSIVLECPFLIETNDGNYVDVSMENVLDVIESGEIFDSKNLKVISKELYTPKTMVEDVVLEHIKEDTARNEFKDDPEAVVLCKVAADGRLEKYVLSSADVLALKEMNERMKREKQSTAQPSHIAEVEIPVSNSDTPLITRILDCGTKVENAISRLPFRKAGYLNMPESNVHERLLDTTLTVDAHHHENMFEELDSQFNTDCSIDNIQRDYVAYEEASKNETQLEHNYYANAMKDEDEECVAINDNYDLRLMMMVDDGDLDNSKTKKRPNLQIIGSTDVCLNGYASSSQGKAPARVNGVLADKGTAVLNAKCDLIINNDAPMSSVLNVPGAKVKRTLNGASKNFRTIKNAATQESNLLPFKSVKSATSYRNSQLEKKQTKRTYKRKATSSPATERKRNGSLNNGGFCNENNLVEEIIIDDIS